MVDTFTPELRLREPEVGARDDLWAPPATAGLNDGVVDMIDEALSNRVNINLTAGDVTLSQVNGATDQHRPMFLNAIGVHGVTRSIIVPDPPTSKLYIIDNGTTQDLIFKTVSGTGTTIGSGQQRVCYVDPVADDCFQIDFMEDLVTLQGSLVSYLTDIEFATAGDTQISILAQRQGNWAMVQIPSFSSTITPGVTFNRFRLQPNTPATFFNAGIGALQPKVENIFALTAGVAARWNIQSVREGVSDFFDVMVTDEVLIADGTVINVPQNVIMTYYTG